MRWISRGGLVSLLLIVLMGSLASDKIVKPIRHLQKTTARIGRGEDVEPLKIRTGDEIEMLANEVNTMNRMLQKSFSGLEHLVQEKTREVLYLKEYTESILMSVPEILVIFNENLKIEYVNAAFEKHIGTGGGKVLGKNLSESVTEYNKQWKLVAEELQKCASGTVLGSGNKGKPFKSPAFKPRDPLAPEAPKDTHEAQPILTLGKKTFLYQFFDGCPVGRIGQSMTTPSELISMTCPVSPKRMGSMVDEKNSLAE